MSLKVHHQPSSSINLQQTVVYSLRDCKLRLLRLSLWVHLTNDADDVKCDKGKCKRAQCCDSVSSRYRCPNNYTSESDSDQIERDPSEFTTDKCFDGPCEPPL